MYRYTSSNQFLDWLICFVSTVQNPKYSVYITEDKENQQMFTFEKLEPVNFCHFTTTKEFLINFLSIDHYDLILLIIGYWIIALPTIYIRE